MQVGGIKNDCCVTNGQLIVLIYSCVIRICFPVTSALVFTYKGQESSGIHVNLEGKKGRMVEKTEGW